MKRKTEEMISDYINRFNTAANMSEKHGMELPGKVKAMKLLHNSGLTANDKKLVLSGMDFSKKDEVYKQAKIGLVKYDVKSENIGLAKYNVKSEDNAGIKLDSGLTNEEEEALVTKGWRRPGPIRDDGRGPGRWTRKDGGLK